MESRLAMKYVEIKEWLKERARKPEARDRLPSVREICRYFKVSQAPVTRAIQELKYEGIIQSRDRSGLVAVSPGRDDVAPAADVKNSPAIVFAFINFLTERVWQQEHVLTQLALANHYTLRCYRSDKGDNFRNLAGFVRRLRETTEIRAVVLNPGSGLLDSATLQELADIGIPVVLNDCTNNYKPVSPFHITRPDPDDLGRCTIRYLTGRGHTKIGVVRCEPNSDLISRSNAVMRDTMKECGLKKKDLFLISDTIHHWDNPFSSAQTLTEGSIGLIRSEGITALVYHSSGGAFAALQSLHKCGLRVPEDVSVIGFGEYSFAEYTIPALTVCTCDYQKMIEDSFSIAIGKSAGQKHLLNYEHRIIERGSVRALC